MNFDEFFRCLEKPDGWHFQVATVDWPHPATPALKWTTFRLWKTEPTDDRLQKARAAALTRPRYFRTCSLCHKLTNAGHMHDDQTCQGCASRHLGIVY